jgi:serine/threonine-protein kinase RsbW
MLKRGNKKIEFGSTMENINLAERFVEEVCDIYNIFNNYFGNITLAVTEAVENAITHGNMLDSEKQVKLEFESHNAGLVFRITDEGMGFDPHLVSDPTEDENALAGRGLYLMRSLSDGVNFLNGGKTIELLFEIASINYQTTIQRRNSLSDYMKGQKIQLNDDMNYRNESS